MLTSFCLLNITAKFITPYSAEDSWSQKCNDIINIDL